MKWIRKYIKIMNKNSVEYINFILFIKLIGFEDVIKTV